MNIPYLPCFLSFLPLLSLPIPALQLNGVLKLAHARVARLGTTREATSLTLNSALAQ